MTSITFNFFFKIIYFSQDTLERYEFWTCRRRRRGIWAEQPSGQKGFSPLPGWLFSRGWLPHLLITNVEAFCHCWRFEQPVFIEAPFGELGTFYVFEPIWWRLKGAVGVNLEG